MASTLRDAYFHSYHTTNNTHISVNSLLDMVRKIYDKKVILSRHHDSYEDHHIHSFLVLDPDDTYQICLLSKMTNCWDRFALCKELFHVVLDEEYVRNPQLTAHLKDFRSSIVDTNNGGMDSSKYEMLTEFAAMQFLFPYARRLDCLEIISARTAKGETKKSVCLEISKEFRIPRLLTEDYLEAQYMDLFNPIEWNNKSDKRR